MSLKKLYIAIFIVCALLVAVFVKKEAMRREQRAQDVIPVAEVVLTKDLSEAFLSRIAVYKGEDENKKLIELARNSDGQWVLENKYGLKVKKENIQNILDQLNDLKGECRAESKDLFPDFQIQDDQSAHIVFDTMSGKPLAHLVVSYMRPEWNKNFIRLFDSDKIALVSKDVLSLFQLFNKDFSPDGIFLADTRLISFDAALIQKINLTNKKDSLIFSKITPDGGGPSQWQFNLTLGKNYELDQTKVSELLQAISGITIKDALDPNGAAYGFEQPTLKMTLEDDKGAKPVQLTVGSLIDSEKSYFVKDDLSNFVVKVPSMYLEKIILNKPDFIKIKEKNTTQAHPVKQIKK